MTDDVELSSYRAAARLGISRQALCTRRMDAILRPIRRDGRRYYKLTALDAYRAMRDAEAATQRELEDLE